MTELKIGRLPDRTPVKLSIAIPPPLHALLEDYATVYAATYGTQETIAELVPAMLQAFLESDRTFMRRRRTASRTRGTVTDNSGRDRDV